MSVDTKPVMGDVTRDQQIHFRVTAEEKKAIETKAKAAGFKKVSDYLRTVGLSADVKEAVPPELRGQLVSLGTQLHQLLHLARNGAAYGPHEAELLQALSLIRGCLV